jgi:hypothetical protein
MNAPTDPDETVTRGDVFLVGFPALFIFAPPEVADLMIEPPGQRLVSGELERFLGLMCARLYLTTCPSPSCQTSSLSIAPRRGRFK